MARRTRRVINPDHLRSQVDRLERERSYMMCIQVARILGYKLRAEPGSVQVDRPGSALFSVYFQLEALVEDFVRDGREVLSFLEAQETQ